MNDADKEKLIERYETTLEPVRTLVSDLSAGALSFVPDLADAWSVNEHLVHILEADQLGWYRFRAAIAEPGTPSPVWNQETWRSRLRYSALDGRTCLEEAVRVRGLIGATCRAVISDDWSEYFILHPQKGRMDLTQLLELYCGHADFHIPYIKRNLTAFGKR